MVSLIFKLISKVNYSLPQHFVYSTIVFKLISQKKKSIAQIIEILLLLNILYKLMFNSRDFSLKKSAFGQISFLIYISNEIKPNVPHLIGDCVTCEIVTILLHCISLYWYDMDKFSFFVDRKECHLKFSSAVCLELYGMTKV